RESLVPHLPMPTADCQGVGNVRGVLEVHPKPRRTLPGGVWTQGAVRSVPLHARAYLYSRGRLAIEEVPRSLEDPAERFSCHCADLTIIGGNGRAVCSG